MTGTLTNNSALPCTARVPFAALAHDSRLLLRQILGDSGNGSSHQEVPATRVVDLKSVPSLHPASPVVNFEGVNQQKGKPSLFSVRQLSGKETQTHPRAGTRLRHSLKSNTDWPDLRVAQGGSLGSWQPRLGSPESCRSHHFIALSLICKVPFASHYAVNTIVPFVYRVCGSSRIYFLLLIFLCHPQSARAQSWLMEITDRALCSSRREALKLNWRQNPPSWSPGSP